MSIFFVETGIQITAWVHVGTLYCPILCCRVVLLVSVAHSGCTGLPKLSLYKLLYNPTRPAYPQWTGTSTDTVDFIYSVFSLWMWVLFLPYSLTICLCYSFYLYRQVYFHCFQFVIHLIYNINHYINPPHDVVGSSLCVYKWNCLHHWPRCHTRNVITTNQYLLLWNS